MPRPVDKFRRDVALLKERLPGLLPVRVYRRPVEGKTLCNRALGVTWLQERKDGTPSHFVVVVAQELSYELAWRVLAHEWAHVLSWSGEHETTCDHDAEWGLAMSRVYSEFVEP